MNRKFALASAILCIAFAGFGIGYVEAARSSDLLLQSSGRSTDVPAYHANPPSGPLPATLDPKQFPETLNQNVYALAAKVKPVLYQLPCYCHCDRNVGHKSLLDCYRDRHGSMCDVCKKEAVYSYEQTRQGKTPGEIREAIINGAWKGVDLSKYAAPSSSK